MSKKARTNGKIQNNNTACKKRKTDNLAAARFAL